MVRVPQGDSVGRDLVFFPSLLDSELPSFPALAREWSTEALTQFIRVQPTLSADSLVALSEALPHVLWA